MSTKQNGALDNLSQAVYNRAPLVSDYIGGSDAAILSDATRCIQEAREIAANTVSRLESAETLLRAILETSSPESLGMHYTAIINFLEE